ncbi:MAG: hypothetical protein JXB36_00980 [Gammaproteobacteria bacterium]|nr:hypothetical protein [Gammaproteobacteria bacterium]
MSSRNNTIRVAAAAVAALAWSAQAWAGHVTDEFENGETRPLSIALLPVEATVVKAKAVDTETLVQEGIEYGAVYAELASDIMTGKGYTVRVIEPDRINADPRLQEYVVDANRRYDEMVSRLRPRRIKRRIYNAGDEVRLLADYLGVDAIAFSRLNVTVTPMGGAIVGALFGGGSSPGTSSTLSIVDGRSGDLEAHYLGIRPVMPGEKSEEQVLEQVADVARRALGSLPTADPSKRQASTASEEDVLNELESLLDQ